MSIKNLIKPENINVSVSFCDTFGRLESEISARWIVKYAQARKNVNGESTWEPILLSDLEAFYHQKIKQVEAFYFNGLTNDHLTLRDGMITINDSFVATICRNHKIINSNPIT